MEFLQPLQYLCGCRFMVLSAIFTTVTVSPGTFFHGKNRAVLQATKAGLGRASSERAGVPEPGSYHCRKAGPRV